MSSIWQWISSTASYAGGYALYGTMYGITAFGTTLFALIWSKHPVRWLLAVAVLGIGVALYYYDLREIDPLLPVQFRGVYFKPWVFVLGATALLTTTHLVGTAWRAYRGPKEAAEGEASAFPDIDAAWQEVQIQMSRARIDLSDQALYILLTPEESLATSVVGAAGLQYFAKAPLSPDAPIHCYAVSDALFLSCAGMYAAGKPAVEGAAAQPVAQGTARLEYLCGLIAAESPERPTLRGIAVLIPYEWTRGADSLLQVSAIRDDLQTIRQVFKLRCPIITVCCVRDSLPGFSEFTGRLPTRERQQRCGFSVPASLSVSGEVLRRGMDWLTRWFELWSLNLMVSDVRNTRGNCRLLAMNLALRESRSNLVGLLESALTVHSQAEPLLYRGCYFVGHGSEPDRTAFVAGLLNGARKGRLLVDKNLTRWSRDADRLDRGYRLAALALGLLSATIVPAIWVFGVIERLRSLNNPAWGWAGITGLSALMLLWAGVLLPPWFRKRFARRA